MTAAEQQKNESVGKHIWNDILQRSIKPFRWGFEFRTVKTITKGTSFRVRTAYIVGVVKITEEQTDRYTITIKPENYGSSIIYKHITSQNLVSTIDKVVGEGILVDNRESQKPKVAA